MEIMIEISLDRERHELERSESQNQHLERALSVLAVYEQPTGMS